MNKFIKIISLTFICVCGLQLVVFAQTTEVLINQAKEAIEKQDYPTAQKILDKVIAVNPKNDSAYAQRSRIFVRKGKYDLALPDAEKSLLINPNNIEALNVRGVVMREVKKDANAAIADFSKALTIDPKYYFAVYNRGLTYAMFGKNIEAIADFTKASELMPNNPSPIFSRAVVYERQEKYNEAIADFSKVTTLNEKSADSFAHRAYCYISQITKKTDLQVPLGKADAYKALELDPKQPIALAVRGFYKYFDKDYDGAVADFEESLKISPNVKWVKNELGRAVKESPAAQARIKAKALADLVEAKKRLESDIFNYQHYLAIDELFLIADPIGDEFMAKKYWESLIAANPKNICAIRFLSEYKYGRNYMEAISFLDGGLYSYDGKNGTECAAQIAFRIGREYSTRLRYDEALSYFEKAKSIKPDLQYLQGNIDATTKQRNARNTEAELAKLTNKQKSEIGKGLANLEEKEQRIKDTAKALLETTEAVEKQKGIIGKLKSNAEIKKEGQLLVDIYNNFLSKYQGKLEKLGVARKDEQIDYLNEEMAKMKAEMERIKGLIRDL